MPFQFGCERWPVERGGRFGPMSLEGAALDEQALAGENGGKRVVPFGQHPKLGFDTEDAGDEILKMGGELQQQRQFLLARGRRLPRGQKPCQKLGRQGAEESVVDPGQALAGIEVGEGEPVGQMKLGRLRQAHRRQVRGAQIHVLGAARLRYCQAMVAAASAVISATS